MTGSELAIILLKVGAVGILVFLNGFFVAAEFGLVKLRDSQLRSRERQGCRKALHARRALSNLDASLSACQLGITLASLGLGWIGEPVFGDLLAPLMDSLGIHNEGFRHSIAFLFGFTTITFLHITAGEQAPKMMAIHRPVQTSLWIAYPLIVFQKASYPLIWLLNYVSTWMLQRVGIDSSGDHHGTHSDEELRIMLSATHMSKGGTVLGRQIILNAMDLRNRLVREVMRPRKEIVFLDLNKSLKDNLDLAFEEEYSRYPLCREGELDQSEGLVHFRDLVKLDPSQHQIEDLLEIKNDLIYVPETARLEKLLEHFLKQKLHLALVVDEYGSVVGMVTLENILEELVGQIQDEFDEEEPLIRKRNASTWELDGATPLHDLSELIGVPLQEEGISTTSGWLTVKLGEFPKKGNRFTVENYQLEVLASDGIQVSKLLLRRLSPKPNTTGEPPTSV
jgi:CBS domain containing-hemolysin-like protein